MSLSANEWKSGMEGGFWKEVTTELNAWVEDMQRALEDPDASNELKDFHQIQGGLKILRNVMALPEVHLESKQLDQERIVNESDPDQQEKL